MKKICKLLLYSGTLLILNDANALENALPYLNRPIAYQGDFGNVELWGQFDFSGKDLDFLGQAKSTQSSYIDKHTNYIAGLNAGLYKGFSLRYGYLSSKQSVLRAVEPKEINTQYDGHDIRLEYLWDFSKNWNVAAQFGFRNHQVNPLEFTKYKSGILTFEKLDGSPIMELASSDHAYLFGLNLSKELLSDFKISIGLEGRFVEVDANFVINESLLQNEAPQQTPWQEQHLVITAAAEWHIWKPFSVAIDFKHYQVWRDNYQAKAGKQDYDNNQQFDFYLFANVYKGLTLYGHAQIMTHYLLGEVPLTYNTRTNHRFNTAYGFISGGFTYHF